MMKNFFFAIFFVFVAQQSKGQHRIDSVWQSHIDRFIDSPHTLIRTELVDHGHIVDCYVQVLRATDLISGKALTGLHFSTKTGWLANVDADEVPSLLAAMNLIENKILIVPPANDAEVCFRSRSGFEAGCIMEDKEWQLYLRLKYGDNNSLTKIKKADLTVFLQILEEVKGQL